MQRELNATNPDAIYLFAVNQVGFESSTDDMATLGDLPLLQDTAVEDVWGTWDVAYRDVVILDGDNERVGVYNLTTYDLEVPANYDALEAMLLDALD